MNTFNSNKRGTNGKSIQQKKQLHAVAKTLLTALPTFSKFLAAINKDILIKAQSSYINYQNTYNQIDNICNLIYNNTHLDVLQKRIKEVISHAPSLYEKVIYLFYHHQLSTAKIASILNVSRRTVFRYLSAATDWFANHIGEIIDSNNFSLLLKNQTWINNIYKRVLAE